MKAKWITFGEVEIEGRRYTSDVVIEAGRVEKRRKKPSKRSVASTATRRSRRRRASLGVAAG